MAPTSTHTLVFLLAAAVFAAAAFAQPPDTLWTRTYGGFTTDVFTGVQQTNDGGYILTGSTHSYGAGSGDVWLIKTDASGNESWRQIFGGSGVDGGWDVKQTDDGGYIITGQTASYGAGSDDIWLIKTDIAGDSLWTQTF